MLQRDEGMEPWTVAEGVGDVARLLLRRVPLALVPWALLLLGLRAYLGMLTDIGGDEDVAARTVASAVGRRPFNIGVAGACLLGLGVGWILARDLIDRVHFTGWIPRSMAIAAALLVIFGTTLILAAWLPAPAAGYFIVLCILGSLLSTVMIAFLTWGE